MEIRSADLSSVWKIRQEVMYPDEDISYVQLPEDGQGIHLGLYRDGMLLSVVSLFDSGESLQFRKFATLTGEQGKGYGSALLKHVMTEARLRGKCRVWCNARVSAIPFYQRFGMQEVGARWSRKEIEFVIMEKRIN